MVIFGPHLCLPDFKDLNAIKLVPHANSESKPRRTRVENFLECTYAKPLHVSGGNVRAGHI